MTQNASVNSFQFSMFTLIFLSWRFSMLLSFSTSRVKIFQFSFPIRNKTRKKFLIQVIFKEPNILKFNDKSFILLNYQSKSLKLTKNSNWLRQCLDIRNKPFDKIYRNISVFKEFLNFNKTHYYWTK